MLHLKLFAASLALTAGLLLALIYVNRGAPRPGSLPDLKPVSGGVFITSQLVPRSIYFLKAQGFHTIVDIRPDGETSDQPTSVQMQQVAESASVQFHYVPVPHTDIPEEAVTQVREILSHPAASGKTVLYCRSGRRAVRTLALAQASQPDGPGVASIMAMARDAGFPANDLRDNITQRIAARTPVAEKR